MRYHTLSMICLPAAFLVMTALLHDRPQNPPAEPERSIETALNVPPRVRAMLRRACYDCHSSETRWPWYSRVPPISGRIEGDVARGRSVINFSEWTMAAGASPSRAAATLRAACAAVERGIMPKSPYPYLHPEARLSKVDIDAFCGWTGEQAAILGANAHRGSVEVQP